MVERHAWIPAIGAEYLVGIDGLSLLLVFLTSLIFPFAFLAQRAGRGFCALMLLMQAALYGTFTAQNFVLWFLFYEMSLIPAFLLIKIWGGENRDRAATKFFVYTFLGSVAMLLSFLGIYFARGTFDFAALAELGKTGLLTGNMAWLAFAGIFLGLAVKVPLFPFHTWLPDAYESAPVGVSMVLTGVLSKMGVYGFIRLLLPLFPHEIQILGPWLLGLAVCSIVLASLAAWAQTDLKRMVAYLSINHLGYCMLGLFAVTAPVGAAAARNAGGVERRLHANLQPRHHRGRVVLLRRIARATSRPARHQRFRRSDATHAAALRLDERRHVFLARPARTERIHRRISHLQRLLRRSRASFTAVATLGLLFTAIVFLRAMQALFSGPLAAELQRLSRSSAKREDGSSFPSRCSCSPSASRRSSSSTSSTPPSFRWRDCLPDVAAMKREIIPVERIAQSIHLLRGQKVMLDSDLAALYGVATKVLNQAVKRNRDAISRPISCFSSLAEEFDRNLEMITNL